MSESCVTDDLITVSVPGVVDQILKDSGYPREEPARWQRYRAYRTTRLIGPSGFAAIVRLPRADWSHVADYLDRALRRLERTAPSDRGVNGKTEIKALRVAVKRIIIALAGEPRG